MEDNHFLDAGLLDRYLVGDASAAECEQVEAWMAAERGRAETVRVIQSGARTLVNADAEWKRFVGKRAHGNAGSWWQTFEFVGGNSLKRWGMAGLGIGACLSVIAVAYVSLAGWRTAVSSSTTSGYTQTYITRPAQRASIRLPDGSHAVLAPDTKLIYSASNDSRRVELTGQAYFTVEHSPKKSFTVTAGGVTTGVLGTSFSVRAYSTDVAAQIAVAEGKVGIANGTILLAGDVGTVAKGKQPVVTHNAKLVDVFGWMRGRLSFDGVPLRDVAYDIERAYNLNITINDNSLAEQLITLQVENKSSSDMIEALAVAVDARVERSGMNVIFSARGSK